MRRSVIDISFMMATFGVVAFMLGIAVGRYLFPDTRYIVVQPASHILNIGGDNDRIP